MNKSTDYQSVSHWGMFPVPREPRAWHGKAIMWAHNGKTVVQVVKDGEVTPPRPHGWEYVLSKPLSLMEEV